MKEYVEYEMVHTAFTLSQIALIESLPDVENITYFIQNEHILPFYPHGPARVMVRKDHADEVREILKDLLSFVYLMELFYTLSLSLPH